MSVDPVGFALERAKAPTSIDFITALFASSKSFIAFVFFSNALALRLYSFASAVNAVTGSAFPPIVGLVIMYFVSVAVPAFVRSLFLLSQLVSAFIAFCN